MSGLRYHDRGERAPPGSPGLACGHERAAPAVSRARAHTGDAAELFAVYLDWYRATVLHKVSVLDEVERRTTRLPSG
jgi:hypothetical protein